jgi:TonB family protein
MRAATVVAVVGLFIAELSLVAQDPLRPAKDLYASAAYEEALLALGRIGDSISPDLAMQADEYRAFCLFALGRTSEAEQIVESLIRKDPLSRLAAADASPRLERMFAEVRMRVLPSLIRERFRTARVAIEQKSYTAAEPPLVDAALMIVEAQKIGVNDQGLDDLSVLVDGFLQLIRSAAEQKAVVQAPSIATTVGIAGADALPPAALPPTPAAAMTRPAAAARVYTANDRDVVPPVTIDQGIPPMPQAIVGVIRASNNTGIMDIVIDENGRVVEATIRQSVNRFFDAVVVRAARQWRYEPARRDGVPVRYLKTLSFVA